MRYNPVIYVCGCVIKSVEISWLKNSFGLFIILLKMPEAGQGKGFSLYGLLAF